MDVLHLEWWTVLPRLDLYNPHNVVSAGQRRLTCTGTPGPRGDTGTTLGRSLGRTPSGRGGEKFSHDRRGRDRDRDRGGKGRVEENPGGRGRIRG